MIEKFFPFMALLFFCLGPLHAREAAREMEKNKSASLQVGLSPLSGGAMATLVLRF